MRHLGNIAAGQPLTFLFPTNDSDGAAIAPTTAGTVSVYQDNSTTETATGVTYTPTFDGTIGVNLVAVDTAGAFYTAGHDYTIVLTGAVIDGQTVNAPLAAFSIVNRRATADNLPADYLTTEQAETLAAIAAAVGTLTAEERSAVADALLDRADAVETGRTPRQALRIMAAILAGKVSGAGSGNESFTGLDGSTLRVAVTADAAGNRTNVNYTAD